MMTQMTHPTFKYESKYWKKNAMLVVGIDEVGRGPLAGPVVAAGVIFDPQHQIIPHVNDSKKVPAKKRILLSKEIKLQAKHWSIGLAHVDIINQKGIVAATAQAMNQVLQQLPSFDHVLIDGRRLTNESGQPPPTHTYIIKGDQKSYSIAAASIIAKVYRDELMIKLSKQHPQYGWERNMGYGTQEHREAIIEHGLTSHHRLQFVQKILRRQVKNRY